MDILPENYMRAFSFKKLGLLMIDNALSWYKRRNFLVVYQKETCLQFIRKFDMKETLEIGEEIFSNEKNFSAFEEGFRKTIIELQDYLENAMKKTKVTINDFFDLQALTNKTFYYFEKTEFFFTDKCYESTMKETTRKNLLTLGEDLKVKARPIFVELITTVLYHYAELVASNFNLETEDLKMYSFDEVISLIEKSQQVSKDTISERKKSYVIYCSNKAIYYPTGKEKEDILKLFEEPDHSEVSEFNGVIANKGKIIGRARVILPELDQPYHQFVKKLLSINVKEGEILVTETTSPDFLPLLRKAKGVIANQGGLNSHAAIFSREFGVPCLVATHNATEVLKTGDLIELDANEGKVRIIKRC